jgi:hypothetical protein
MLRARKGGGHCTGDLGIALAETVAGFCEYALRSYPRPVRVGRLPVFLRLIGIFLV